jgi:hypothetical protein
MKNSRNNFGGILVEDVYKMGEVSLANGLRYQKVARRLIKPGWIHVGIQKVINGVVHIIVIKVSK